MNILIAIVGCLDLGVCRLRHGSRIRILQGRPGRFSRNHVDTAGRQTSIFLSEN